MTDIQRSIRVLSAGEVAELVDWAAAEGWNPGHGDAEAFRAADPDGFLGAFAGGRLVAGMSAVRYGAGFGFIGLYICRPDCRGQGHGRALWDAGMARLSGRTVGLDGVPEQQANYARIGFAKAYGTVRYSGAPRLGEDLGGTAGVGSGADHSEAVLAYDAACFPAERQRFAETWLRAPRRVRVLSEDGAVRGFGVLRECREGAKIGPLFADDAATASTLFAALGRSAPGLELHIDVPETAPDFATWLVGLGMHPGFETARMYRGPAPALPTGKIFAITSLELG